MFPFRFQGVPCLILLTSTMRQAVAEDRRSTGHSSGGWLCPPNGGIKPGCKSLAVRLSNIAADCPGGNGA